MALGIRAINLKVYLVRSGVSCIKVFPYRPNSAALQISNSCMFKKLKLV